MQNERRFCSYHFAKEEKYRHFILRRVKYVNSMLLERCFSKKILLAMGQLIGKNLKHIKVLYKIKWIYAIYSPLPLELSEGLIKRLQYPIYHRFSKTLVSFRSLTNFPLVNNLKALKSLNLFWDKQRSEMPNYIRKLSYIEVVIKKDYTTTNNKNLIKLKRMTDLQDMKLTGTTCQLWKIFTYLKDKIKTSTPNFHLTFSLVDIDPSNMQKFANQMPWFNHKSMEYMNTRPDSVLNQLIPITNMMSPLQHFGYFQIGEPRSESIINSSSLQYFQNFENILSLALNFYENIDKKVLENFFLYICFPRKLEVFKLTLFLKDFLVNRCCMGHYYQQIGKLTCIKELVIMAKFNAPPKFDVVDRLWKHYLEVLRSLEGTNPLETLTIGLQSPVADMLMYDIAFDQSLLPVIWKFDRIKELKLYFHLAKISWVGVGMDAFQDGIFTNLNMLFIHAADLDPRFLKLIKSTARDIQWLSIDLYLPLQYAKLIEICKYFQSIKSLNACHIQPHAPTLKDGKEADYYQRALVREIQMLYLCLINLKKGCFCFPYEEVDRKYCEDIGNSFKWNKKIECTKVETKSWTILNDVRSPGRFRFCNE